jgi:FeS assembly SUF system regulator
MRMICKKRFKMRFSKLTDYAVVILTALKDSSVDNSAAASVLAKETTLPEPTVSKVLKMLARHDLVLSQRGATGGYSLTRPLNEISILDVLTSIEGPLSMTECVSDADSCCSLEAVCSLNGRWNIVNRAVEQTLHNISLADMQPKMKQNLTQKVTATG